MKLVIGIATYKRVKKLERLLESIYKNSYKNFSVVVIADNKDVDTAMLVKARPNLEIVWNEKQEYVIGSWNKFHKEYVNKGDAHITLCDDVELFPTTLESLVGAMRTKYPDLDGVIGISQEYPGHLHVPYNPAGQVMIGRKFLERYGRVEYQVCCPRYIQWYQDEEMRIFATNLGKFYLDPNSKLIHHHPIYFPSEMDETHGLVRGKLHRYDTQVHQERMSKKLIWGESFE